jgi:hypothetical protein
MSTGPWTRRQHRTSRSPRSLTSRLPLRAVPPSISSSSQSTTLFTPSRSPLPTAERVGSGIGSGGFLGLVRDRGPADVKLSDIDTTTSGTAVTVTSAPDPYGYKHPNNSDTTLALGSAAGALGVNSALDRRHSVNVFAHRCFAHRDYWLEIRKCA